MNHNKPSAPQRTQQPLPTQMTPLNVLQCVVQTSVGFMELADGMVAHQASLRVAEKTRRAQMLTFSALDKRLDAALQIPTQASEELRLLIGRIAEGGRRELELAFDDLNLTRQGREEEYRRNVASQCHSLIDTLLGRNTLPQSKTDLYWDTRDGALNAQLDTQLHRGLQASFRVAIPHEDLWSKPIRVSELATVTIPELVTRPWSAPQWKERKLDGYFIVAATWTETKRELILAKRAKRASSGYRISFDSRVGITITAIDAEGEPTEEPRRLDGNAAWSLQQLWTHATQELSAWTHRPRQLVKAELNGNTLSAAPDAVAVALLETVAKQIISLGAAREQLCDESLWKRVHSLNDSLRAMMTAKLQGQPSRTKPAAKVATAPKPAAKAAPVIAKPRAAQPAPQARPRRTAPRRLPPRRPNVVPRPVAATA